MKPKTNLLCKAGFCTVIVMAQILDAKAGLDEEESQFVSDKVIVSMGAPPAKIVLSGAAPAFCAPWKPGKKYDLGSYMMYNYSVWRAKFVDSKTNPDTVWEPRPFSDCIPGDFAGPLGGVRTGLPDLQEALRDEERKTSSLLFQHIKKSVRMLDLSAVKAVAAGLTNNPANVQRVERVLSPNDWELVFPIRHKSYTYDRFLKAVARFPAFCGDADTTVRSNDICYKSLATLLTHVVMRTGAHNADLRIPAWQQGLYFLRKSECNEKGLGCGYVTFASAIHFFVHPRPPKPSMLAIVDGSWQPNNVDTVAQITNSFAATTNVISGGVECGKGAVGQKELHRAAIYLSMAGFFGVPIERGEALNCVTMAPFPLNGAADQALYWDANWQHDFGRIDGKTYSCNLVSYKTSYSALKPGDYVRCVQHYFNIELT